MWKKRTYTYQEIDLVVHKMSILLIFTKTLRQNHFAELCKPHFMQNPTFNNSAAFLRVCRWDNVGRETF